MAMNDFPATLFQRKYQGIAILDGCIAGSCKGNFVNEQGPSNISIFKGFRKAFLMMQDFRDYLKIVGHSNPHFLARPIFIGSRSKQAQIIVS